MIAENNVTDSSPHMIADLAWKVGQAIDEHANPIDESEATPPGVQLDPTRDAEAIDRLQRGGGGEHAIKLHTAADGTLWAVNDWDAQMRLMERADAEYDARPQPSAAGQTDSADADRPTHHSPAANVAYEHIGVMAGRRLLEALLQGEMTRKEQA